MPVFLIIVTNRGLLPGLGSIRLVRDTWPALDRAREKLQGRHRLRIHSVSANPVADAQVGLGRDGLPSFCESKHRKPKKRFLDTAQLRVPHLRDYVRATTPLERTTVGHCSSGTGCCGDKR